MLNFGFSVYFRRRLNSNLGANVDYFLHSAKKNGYYFLFFLLFHKLLMIIQRIKAYLDAKKISVNAFENKVGMSHGAFRKAVNENKSIQTDRLEKIISIYEDISPVWLLTGKGNMIDSENNPSKQTPENSSIESNELIQMVEIIRKQAEEIGELKEQVRQLEFEKNLFLGGMGDVEDVDTSYHSHVG